MSSGDLIPNDHDHAPVANEVQFALVIARMHACPENPGPWFHRWGQPRRSQAMHRADRRC